jgi:hypothetical protein
MAAAVAAVLVLAACSATLTPAGSGAPAVTPSRSVGSPNGKVIALDNISTLRTLFNRDSGHPRLILIFSPT